MEGGNIENSKSIRNYMKGMMNDIDPRKESFDLIKFNGAKVVQVAGE